MKNGRKLFEQWIQRADVHIAGLGQRQSSEVRTLLEKAFKAGGDKALNEQTIDCSEPGVLETLRHRLKVTRTKRNA